jgi:adenylate cyclase class 2
MLDNVEVALDEWPFLEPFIEVEGKSEKEVKRACQKMGFDFSKALFCAVGELYHRKYGIPVKIINDKTPRIVFGGKNPFEDIG